jgi:hypothetical protein
MSCDITQVGKLRKSLMDYTHYCLTFNSLNVILSYLIDGKEPLKPLEININYAITFFSNIKRNVFKIKSAGIKEKPADILEYITHLKNRYLQEELNLISEEEPEIMLDEIINYLSSLEKKKQLKKEELGYLLNLSGKTSELTLNYITYLEEAIKKSTVK